MSKRRYVILTLEDARELVNHIVRSGVFKWLADDETRGIIRIYERLRDDTVADIEDIVGQLKRLDLCAPCVIEGMPEGCCAHDAQKLGRRLSRLLERARGERAPGDRPDPKDGGT